MTALAALGWRLARSGGPLRTWSVVGSNALGTLLLLGAVAVPVAAHGDFAYVPERRMTSALILMALTLPVVVLLLTAGRLSSSTRDKQLAALRLVGLSPARTRVVAGIENGLLSALGAAAGLLLALPVLPVVEGLVRANTGWFVAPLRLPGALTLPVSLAAIALSLLASLLPTRMLSTGPRGGLDKAADMRAGLWRLAPVILGVGFLSVAGATDTFSQQTRDAAMLLGLATTGLAIPLVVPLVTRWTAELLVRRRGSVVARLAARRLQVEPASAVRVVAGLGIVTYAVIMMLGVLTAMQNTPQYLAAQQYVTTGPQQIPVRAESVGGAPGAREDISADDAAQLARVPGVEHVLPEWSVLAAPGEVDLDEIARQLDPEAIDGLPMVLSTFVGTCQDLAELVAVSGCNDSAAAWIRPDRPRPDRDETELPTSPTVTVFRNTDSESPTDPVTVSLSSPPIVQDVTATMDRWVYPDGLDVFLPVDLPELARTLGEPTGYLVIADGGLPVREAVLARSAELNVLALPYPLGDYSSVMTTRAVMWTLGAVMLAVGLLTVLLGAIDRAVERRRAVASQVVIGVPLRVLRAGQLVQTFVPMLLTFVVAALLGALALRTYAVYGGFPEVVPWSSLVVLIVATLVGALVVALVTLPGVGGRLSPESLRRE